jgi:hypothetical protein
LTQNFQTYFNVHYPVDYGNLLGRKKKGAFMNKFMWFAIGCVALLWSSVGSAQVACPGDCNDDNRFSHTRLVVFHAKPDGKRQEAQEEAVTQLLVISSLATANVIIMCRG